MGVRGFYKVLQEEGWLPDDASCPCCATSLWRDPKIMHVPKFAANVSQVKQRSTLFIDGAGLCFHLYRIAYARRAAEVLGQSQGRRRNSTSRPCSAKNLRMEQVTKLLPNLLPLTKLDEVTREFVDTLKKRHHMKLVVYFDGKLRRETKRETDEKRQRRRPEEWSALQQYCCNGIMPSVDRVCQWEDRFPKNRLFISQVKYTLQLCHVDIAVCEEEADAELARQASKVPNSYVAGMDTDFCFFKGAKYIPLKTLDADGTVVTACVISRKALAESLHLPDEQAMVELSILMGNDYVGTSPKDKFDFASRNATDIMDHLRDQGKGYRVSSTSGDQTAEAIRFTRAFYNLQDLGGDFPLASPKEKDGVDEVEEFNGAVMKIPADFPDHLAIVQSHDISLLGTVLRCLQAYVDQVSGNDDAVLKQEHLDALKLLTLYQQDNRMVAWRPSWEDVPACFLIESCVAYVLKRSAGSPLVKLTSPGKIFDAYKFHNTLFKLRNQEEPAQQPTKNIKKAPESLSNCSMKEEMKLVARAVLPIDEHEERILEAIRRNRVTIIEGETGCGKSSRVPIMIMEAPVPDNALREVKLFISQPRRIAAKALVERLRATEPDLGKNIALRMGHGVREYENSGTRAWFVTTGYLVRLLSSHPDNFKKVSHLIIDEIHERSVDTDILCLLCRRLLHTNTHIRLILMSATMAAELYQQYFKVAEPPIKVGARRFPIHELFVEDLPESLQLPPRDIKAVRLIEAECRKTCCIAPPSNSAMESIYNLSARLAITVGKPGSSVLIFVPGMKDIESITEVVERMYVAGVTHTCIPIHSDIPFEDQMMVFDKTDEVKIIIATNAAESSITLPDCDHVICTGLQKQITYNASSHRQMLSPCWISKASAQQRSGRVGRVRPGTVFRLYTREAYENMMEFESGEMLRMPLDSVILTLKEILHEDTTPALLNCLEPPDLSTIERSYESLHRANFISLPNDSGNITVLGAFVLALGVDLALGALIGLGIQFGVGPEAIELAAVLSFPQPPWLLSNSLVHKPKSFNSGIVKTYMSRNQFDASIYSEPIATMNLIYEYSRLHGSRLSSFCNYHGVHNTRIRRLISTKNNLVSRVADFVKIDPGLLKVSVPPTRMHHSKLTILRVIQVWVFHETIIEYNPLPRKSHEDGSFTVALKSNDSVIEETHLSTLLRSDRHPHLLKTNVDVVQAGGFYDEDFDLGAFLSAFEDRFVSYATEKKLDVAWFWSDLGMQLYASSKFYESPDFQNFRKLWDDVSDESVLHLREAGNHRGLGERACGHWLIQDPSNIDETDSTLVLQRKFITREAKLGNGISNALRSRFRKCVNIDAAISFDFSKNSNRNRRNRSNALFQIFCTGANAFKVTDGDLCDLLAIGKQKGSFYLVNKHVRRSQHIHFLANDNVKQQTSSEGGSPGRRDEDCRPSLRQPLLRNAPEGARILAVLAASRRREQNIQIPISVDAEDSEELDDDQVVSFSLDDGLSKMLSRWTRFNTDRAVFVYENSVPASVIPIDFAGALYSCCANTLDLRGGGLRAEGLTLLPPGSLFLLLALLTFGLAPEGLGSIPKENEDLNEFVVHCTSWIEQKDNPEGNTRIAAPPLDKNSRIRMAIELSRSSVGLGDKLVCFPDKVKLLCKIFDNVDGYESGVWPKLELNPFIPTSEHVGRSRDALLAALPKSGSSYGEVQPNGGSQRHFEGVYPDMQDESGCINLDISSVPALRQGCAFQGDGYLQFEAPLRGKEVLRFSEELLSKFQAMFASGLDGVKKNSSALPSTNILALCSKQFYAGLVYEAFMQASRSEECLQAVARFSKVSLTRDHWIVYQFVDGNDREWYRALFVDSALPLNNRSTRGMKAWVRHLRPWTFEDALECVPSEFRHFTAKQCEVYVKGAEKEKALLFDNIELAVRMEAAFFLERLFSHSNKRWYEQSFSDLMQQMQKRAPPISETLQRLLSVETEG